MSSSVHATFKGNLRALIEALESRQLLSSVNFYSNSLYIDGDETDDHVVIQYKPNSSAFEVILNGVTYDQTSDSSIDWIDIDLGAGNDQFSFKINGSDDLHVYIYARAGNDSISGSAGRDNIYGGDG